MKSFLKPSDKSFWPGHLNGNGKLNSAETHCIELNLIKLSLSHVLLSGESTEFRS